MAKPLTDPERDEIVKLATARGRSVAHIANLIGRSQFSVRKVIRGAGIDTSELTCHLPSLKEIRQATIDLQEKWSGRECEKRAVGPERVPFQVQVVSTAEIVGTARCKQTEGLRKLLKPEISL